ncbi:MULTISPECIES: LmeA family phospholipid-binding protein [Synechococcales]|uniref:LmeA family phospholipid-binding protein n=1 Tax=Synechococcus sp. CS-1325 TaxID=2847979 RepID=UPI00223C50E2|nr:DUF2993 domain-containing protein [Synechococcus sp. CS-1325]
MAGTEPADTSIHQGSGPLLQLIAAGLQVWIRSQCEAVESLELQLHGTAIQLLRGRLEGITLMARRVVYQELQIELVQLRSDPLQLRLGQVLKGEPIRLDHPFLVRGQVAFTAAGLSGSLVRPRWQLLADFLGEQLLGLSPLKGLRIVRDTLVFTAQAAGESRLMELETRPEAIAGSLGILSLDGDLRLRLPMDPNIRLETANLEGGMLQLHGEAQVTP